MKRNEQLSLIFELLSKAVANLPDDELDRVVHGTHIIDLKIVRNRSSTKVAVDSESLKSAEIAKELESFSDRGIASNHLREIALNKKSLELLARHLDIAVSKQDKTEDLVNKIIESTVGARLRSSAIRGPEA
ncbi:hypothetical protein [Acidovorax sp.]|uniref:hypothetical protein n=1 Tax=Acidovorax sp. TaxID=1872122 RepID=UPI003918FCF4